VFVAVKGGTDSTTNEAISNDSMMRYVGVQTVCVFVYVRCECVCMCMCVCVNVGIESATIGVPLAAAHLAAITGPLFHVLQVVNWNCVCTGTYMQQKAELYKDIL